MAGRGVLGTCVVAITALWAIAPPAGAATVALDGGVMRFAAGPSESNQLQVARAGDVYVLSDPGAVLTPGAGCAAGGEREVRCAAANVSRLEASMGDFADGVVVAAPLASILDGGDGDDFMAGGPAASRFIGGAGLDTVLYFDHTNAGVTVTPDGVADDGTQGEGDNVGEDVERIDGGPRADTLNAGGAPRLLFGNAGDDTLVGSAGDDTELHGGDGNDRIDGGAGGDTLYGEAGVDSLDGSSGADRLVGGQATDELIGGAGTDTVTYADHAVAVRATLDGVANDGQPGENDSIARDVESLDGSPQNDVLTGDDGPNRLDGRLGRDVLDGRGGDDQLVGENHRDVLRGGAGNDALDMRSIFSSDESGFEGVEWYRATGSCGGGRDSVLADGADRIARDCELVDRGIHVSRKIMRPSRTGVIPVRVTCGRPRACRLGIELRFRIGTSNYRSRPKGVTLAAGRTTTVHVRLNARALRAIRGVRRATGQTVITADLGSITPLTLLRPRG